MILKLIAVVFSLILYADLVRNELESKLNNHIKFGIDTLSFPRYGYFGADIKDCNNHYLDDQTFFGLQGAPSGTLLSLGIFSLLSDRTYLVERSVNMSKNKVSSDSKTQISQNFCCINLSNKVLTNNI